MDNITRGAVYLANLDPTIGSEQNGYRPVLVIQNDIGNKYSPTTIIIPISAKKKHQLPMHILLNKNDFLDYDSIVLLEQIRVIDKTRLVKYLGNLSDDEMQKISDSIVIELGISGKDFKSNLFLKNGM